MKDWHCARAEVLRANNIAPASTRQQLKKQWGALLVDLRSLRLTYGEISKRLCFGYQAVISRDFELLGLPKYTVQAGNVEWRLLGL